jgi:hypothetical protein
VDIVAHGLWAASGAVLARRRGLVDARTAAAAVALAVLPDLPHGLPVLAWALSGEATLAAVRDYALAAPGQEPVLPAPVALASHHLHCVLHSGVVAAAMTLAWWIATRSLGFALLGWWSHIVIDVVTHSADFFPSPVLYPLSYRGFDGIAWNEPWFVAANYLALALAWLWLWVARSRRAAAPPGAPSARASSPS